MGDFPTPDDNAELDQDPQRLVGLTAHAVARIADRFPLARKFSRHMEGKEKRAGILSDIGAACVCLYKRNPQAMEALAVNFRAEVQAAHQRRVTSNQSTGPHTNGATPQPGGVVNA